MEKYVVIAELLQYSTLSVVILIKDPYILAYINLGVVDLDDFIDAMMNISTTLSSEFPLEKHRELDKSLIIKYLKKFGFKVPCWHGSSI